MVMPMVGSVLLLSAAVATADQTLVKLDEGAIDYFDANTKELVVNDNSYFVTDKLVIIQRGNKVSIDTIDKQERVTVFGIRNEGS